MLLGCDREGRNVIETARFSQCGTKRRPPCCRVDLRAVGVRGATFAHQRATVGVTDDDLAGLRRGVDASDKRHVNCVESARAEHVLDRELVELSEVVTTLACGLDVEVFERRTILKKVGIRLAFTQRRCGQLRDPRRGQR